ncbi:hypothetical protein [Streptomyces sp. 6N223]|uniref:hypothetical protein n=1 Tax=Streptomyces sp. 6N223 TaxID=3457412 RepID=UPI003FD13130
MLGTCAGVVTLLASGPAYIGVPLIALGLLGLWRGVTYGLRYRRLGGEVFAVRERGLVYRRAGVTTAIPWQDIDGVTVSGRGGALLRLFGYDATCRVRLSRGDTLRVSRFTRDGRSLAETTGTYAGRERIPVSGSASRARISAA